MNDRPRSDDLAGDDAAPEAMVKPPEMVGFNPDEEIADAALTEFEQLASRFRDLLAEHEVDPRAAEISRTNIDTAVLWARVAVIG